MAYQQDFLDDESKKDASTPAGEQVLGPEGTSLVTGAGGSAPTPAKSTRGSGFTNLSQYVNANKEQSGAMADTITSGINTDINKAQQGTEQLRSNVGQTATQNTVKDQGVIGALQNSPQQFAQQQWQDLFKKQTAGYHGPEDISNLQPYQDLSKTYGSIDTRAKSLQDANQIGQTIKDTYKPGAQYTKGQNLLDSFLLTSGEGANHLNQFTNDYNAQNLPQSFQNTATDLNTQLKNAKTTTENTKQATQSAYQNSLNSLNSVFQQEQAQAAQERANATSSSQDLQNKLRAGDVATEKSIGLDPNTAKWLQSQGLDLSGLVSAPTQTRSLGDIASEGQVSGYQALLGLQPGQQSAYDFSKTGLTSAAAPNIAQNKVDAGSQLYNLQQSLNTRTSQGQAQRDQEYRTAQDAINVASVPQNIDKLSSADLAKYASILGISPQDYKFAAKNGLINPGALTAGDKLGSSNVISDSESQQYNNLLAQLGITGSGPINASKAGSAYTANSGALQNSISGLKNAQAVEQSNAKAAQASQNAASAVDNARLQQSLAMGSVNILPSPSNDLPHNITTSDPKLLSRLIMPNRDNILAAG